METEVTFIFSELEQIKSLKWKSSKCYWVKKHIEPFGIHFSMYSKAYLDND